MRTRFSAFIAALLLLHAALGWAQGVVAVPPLSAHVIDSTATLSADAVQALDAKLVAFEAAHGTQLVVLMLPTTQPEDIASYANRVGNDWKIGRKAIGDGLLVIVAKNDRAVRIEVAKTLEGAIPDLAAKRVIEQAITPRFKQGDFAGGLQAGTDQLMSLVQGEALPAPSSDARARMGTGGFQWKDGLVFLFFAVFMGGAVARRIFGNKLGSALVGGAVGVGAMVLTSSVVIAVLAGFIALVATLLSSLSHGLSNTGSHGWGGHSGGSWGSGSGGGGFGSGGGGDFGGGGASGRW